MTFFSFARLNHHLRAISVFIFQNSVKIQVPITPSFKGLDQKDALENLKDDSAGVSRLIEIWPKLKFKNQS